MDLTWEGFVVGPGFQEEDKEEQPPLQPTHEVFPSMGSRKRIYDPIDVNEDCGSKGE